MRVVELKKKRSVLISRCKIAESFIPRFMGLMGQKEITGDMAIVFPKCNSIHTFFMRMPIDVVFIGKNGMVVELIESLGPWRMLLPRGKAKHVVEMQAGRARELGILAGDELFCEGVWS